MAYPERHDDKIRHFGGEARRLVCPSISCAADGWQIERDLSHPETWVVTAEETGASWSIAATEPVCPYCAATLAEQHEPALDIGPFSRFVRSLAA